MLVSTKGKFAQKAFSPVLADCYRFLQVLKYPTNYWRARPDFERHTFGSSKLSRACVNILV